jgi:hypothetical protein
MKNLTGDMKKERKKTGTGIYQVTMRKTKKKNKKKNTKQKLKTCPISYISSQCIPVLLYSTPEDIKKESS